uniref:Uncharacterized protein n=1 Tax=Trichuris muris TaxID=70415 RepID=A0A5S6R3H1_TRIMR
MSRVSAEPCEQVLGDNETRQLVDVQLYLLYRRVVWYPRTAVMDKSDDYIIYCQKLMTQCRSAKPVFLGARRIEIENGDNFYNKEKPFKFFVHFKRASGIKKRRFSAQAEPALSMSLSKCGCSLTRRESCNESETNVYTRTSVMKNRRTYGSSTSRSRAIEFCCSIRRWVLVCWYSAFGVKRWTFGVPCRADMKAVS